MDLYVIKIQNYVHKHGRVIYKICTKNIKICEEKNSNFSLVQHIFGNCITLSNTNMNTK